jgi:hypothetical protein
MVTCRVVLAGNPKTPRATGGRQNCLQAEDWRPESCREAAARFESSASTTIVISTKETHMTKLLSTLLFAAATSLAFNVQAASHAGAAPMAKASEAKADAKKAEAKKDAKPADKAASAADKKK